jgi:hypothetical protein
MVVAEALTPAISGLNRRGRAQLVAALVKIAVDFYYVIRVVFTHR